MNINFTGFADAAAKTFSAHWTIQKLSKHLISQALIEIIIAIA